MGFKHETPRFRVLRAAAGPTNTLKAKDEAPWSLRARYGTDGTQNACHGSDSPESSAREVDFMFPLQDTFAIIKPYAEKVEEGEEPGPYDPKGDVAAALQRIRVAGLSVTHIEDSTLTPEEALVPVAAGAVTKIIVQGRGAIKALPALVAEINASEAIEFAAASTTSAAKDIETFFPVQQTYAAIKPDAMAKKADIMAAIAENGFTVVAQEEATLTKEHAMVFYSEHKEADFFEPLTDHMSSGPMTKLVLEKRGAVKARPALPKIASRSLHRALFNATCRSRVTRIAAVTARTSDL